MIALQTSADLDALLDASRNGGVLIFKHSTACPTSAFAFDEFELFALNREHEGPVCAIVLVIESRPLSREIEARFSIRHESPQAIWIRDGVAHGALSQGAITEAALKVLVER
ncbi:MAG: bacillithiol system redox-active protein YtxJ [Planctomycetes bacterium]|nr:bacillithiol system redox-active protein YtxJ [Planctomycetota bacterium]